MEDSLVKAINKQPTEIRELIASFHKKNVMKDTREKEIWRKKAILLGLSKNWYCYYTQRIIVFQLINDIYGIKIPFNDEPPFITPYDLVLNIDNMEIVEKMVDKARQDVIESKAKRCTGKYIDDLKYEVECYPIEQSFIYFDDGSFSRGKMSKILMDNFVKYYHYLEV